MNWQTVTSSLIILCGAAVMLSSIIRSGVAFKAVSFFPVQSRSSIVRFLRFHRLLMIFFLLGYIVVAFAFPLGLRPVGELFVSVILLCGAIFVFLGIMLQSRVFAETQVTVHSLEDALRDLRALNQELEQQSSQLQATVEIARAGSTILEPDELMAKVVNQIQDGFSPMGVYYVGLFLVSEDGQDAAGADTGQQFAMLRAATGEAGKLLLEIGHKLPLDETSMIGWCITHEQARIALDVSEEPVRFSNPILEPTRSEIALPLSSRGRILGALSVQSSREQAFDEADIAVLQAMADHVAAAVDNAHLFRRTEVALQEMRAVQRRYLERGWTEFLSLTPQTRVDYTQAGAEPAGNGQFLQEARRAAVVHQRTVAANVPHPGAGRQREETASVPHVPPKARPGGSTEPLDQASGQGSAEVSPESDSGQAALVVPLKLGGQVVGTMALHETRRDRPWTAEEIGLAETIAEQVVQTVENLRLMDETQRRAAREQMIGEVTARVRETLDIDTVLQTIVREIGEALGIAEVEVRMSSGVMSER
jgi:GAF domain-containing protein